MSTTDEQSDVNFSENFSKSESPVSTEQLFVHFPQFLFEMST